MWKWGNTKWFLLKDWRSVALGQCDEGNIYSPHRTHWAMLLHSTHGILLFSLSYFSSSVMKEWRTQSLYYQTHYTVNRLTLSLSTLCICKIRPNIKQDWIDHTLWIKPGREQDVLTLSLTLPIMPILPTQLITRQNIAALATLAIARSCSGPVSPE